MPRKSRPKCLNERIEALCEARGLHFGPHEIPPWEADEGPSPYPPTSAGSLTWPMAQSCGGSCSPSWRHKDAEA
jgi:hypothetical protein